MTFVTMPAIMASGNVTLSVKSAGTGRGARKKPTITLSIKKVVAEKIWPDGVPTKPMRLQLGVKVNAGKVALMPCREGEGAKGACRAAGTITFTYVAVEPVDAGADKKVFLDMTGTREGGAIFSGADEILLKRFLREQ
ncbi:hypothetical protein [Thalassobius sp. Cn5-15]|uniref:hypothetical protein n=1 Tax=Thalassobius sp. Cn5-15 TaxID=2917763 RepID=UPI001EF34C45|nr:hypothetical protein [Thalassobius sp. Cn5-15]MCG7492412.1 hypothetical protein [Thalassobius sp. Cn5-15]